MTDQIKEVLPLAGIFRRAENKAKKEREAKANRPIKPQPTDWSQNSPKAITVDGYYLFGEKVTKEEYDSYKVQVMGANPW